MNKFVLFVMTVLLVVTGSITLLGQAQTEKLATGTYTVYAVAPQAWRFSVDAKTMANATVTGHFAITEGTPKNIEVMVFAEDAFFKWRGDDEAAKANAKPIWTSGRKTEGDLAVKLTDSGNYYVVFSNMFAYDGTKSLTADVKLQYDKK